MIHNLNRISVSDFLESRTPSHTHSKQQATEYLGPDEIFKGELDEALTKIKFALKVLENFKEDFEV